MHRSYFTFNAPHRELRAVFRRVRPSGFLADCNFRLGRFNGTKFDRDRKSALIYPRTTMTAGDLQVRVDRVTRGANFATEIASVSTVLVNRNVDDLPRFHFSNYRSAGNGNPRAATSKICDRCGYAQMHHVKKIVIAASICKTLLPLGSVG